MGRIMAWGREPRRVRPLRVTWLVRLVRGSDALMAWAAALGRGVAAEMAMMAVRRVRAANFFRTPPRCIRCFERWSWFVIPRSFCKELICFAHALFRIGCVLWRIA